jgi:mitochondrial Rho GTPase 1
MQVFQHACDACVNPVLVLYNHVRERLRCKAVRAFNRIMDIVDEDQDGALNDDELNRFNLFCFGRAIRADELKSIKQVRCRWPSCTLLLLT